jgi:NTE family protein
MHDKSAIKHAPVVGLVLSGGGAKGAYQVGVLKALNELNIQVDVISGASIGSLNGAIIASAKSQKDAAENLEKLWMELSSISPISIGSKFIQTPAYLALLGAFGMTSPMLGSITFALKAMTSTLDKPWLPDVIKRVANQSGIADIISKSNGGMLCDRPIKRMIDRLLPDSGLPDKVPLYVSVYPTQGTIIDFFKIAGSLTSVKETLDSQFLHIQSLALSEQKKALLASAALPLLYAPREINGQLYTDGGQGGWSTVQGNTPIAPLLKAGCRQIIVTHLSDGSFWNRTQFPNATIIEIRPKTSAIERSQIVGSDLLGFDNTRISSWIQQGYEDTHGCVGPIVKTLKAFGELDASETARDHALRITGESALKIAMERLKSV